MTTSMTGFAASKGEGLGFNWAWDIRSVNGKGLDLRLRLPDWVEGLEALVRAETSRALTRGNVQINLKLARDGAGAASSFRLNPEALAAALSALAEVEHAAQDRGLALRPATAADVLSLRGVTEAGDSFEDHTPLRAAVMAGYPALLADFHAMRAAEGAALAAVIAAQLDRIDAHLGEAVVEAEARKGATATALAEALARIMANVDGVDPSRLTQELALLAVKSDVTEELDRLRAHIAAARALLADPAAVGRKFDFLCQEFTREANTLCSKSQSKTLTRIGLDLKTVIDQMREQVQNVE